MEDKKYYSDINNLGSGLYKSNSLTRYDRTIHLYGKVSIIIVLFVLLSVPFLIARIFNVNVSFAALKRPEVILFILLWMGSCIVEVVTYAGLLGNGGSYLAFVTGNLINLKIPCAENANSIAKTSLNTKENDLISTISIASSSIVTTLIIAIGVLLLTPLEPILAYPVMKPGFESVVFALFGAIGYKYFRQFPKLVILPMLVVIPLCIFVPSLRSNIMVLLLIGAVITILNGVVLLKLKKI